MSRFVIVNADDFGLTAGVNRGIIESHERGVVTSASLMVRYPAAEEAAELARASPKLSVGLHLDLAEWRFEKGEWRAAYEVVNTRDAEAVRAEARRQLSTFVRLLGRNPTHLDSHQHVHCREPARSIMVAIAAELGVPLRSCTPTIRYAGDFYGQTGEGEPFPEGISEDRFRHIVEHAAPGWTEMGCHAGYSDDLDSVYRTEREEEVRVLCGAAARAAITQAKIKLSSFGDLAGQKKTPAKAPAP